MKSLISAVTLSIFFLYKPSLALSAEITPIQSHPMGCEYKLTGLINNGDAEKVDKVLQQEDWFATSARGWKICLDSPGGSFIEGVKLAQTFAQNGIGTVVAENDVCESACAIAFMGGSFAHPEAENAYVSRTMHATAKLGFHAPALLIPDGKYSEKEVDSAYSIALKAVLELSDMRSSGHEIRESLFRAILSTSFEEMHYVDTIGKALRYKINISGIRVSTADAQSIAKNICDNAVIAIEDSDPWFGGGREFKFIAANILHGEQGYYEEANFDCLVEIGYFENRVGTNSFQVNFQAGPDDTNIRASTFLPPYASFRSDTLLASAFSAKSISVDNFLVKARKAMKGSSASDIPKTCAILNQSAAITNVQNFTNLRRQAGLNGQVIGQVPLGATVTVVNPGQFLRYDRCAAACNGSNQNAIRQCIDNNDVWIEVEYNGRRGFLSRKFLE